MNVEIEWISVKEKVPAEFGWYLVAINPANFEELGELKNNNPWREDFGCTKLWYNNSKFWEQRVHSSIVDDVTERVTHWSYLPKVPMYE